MLQNHTYIDRREGGGFMVSRVGSEGAAPDPRKSLYDFALFTDHASAVSFAERTSGRQQWIVDRTLLSSREIIEQRKRERRQLLGKAFPGIFRTPDSQFPFFRA